MLASLATLTDIVQQRDPRIVLDVKLSKPVLRIGKDALDLSIQSSHDGYIYLVLLGSDRKSFYVLYPNGLDKETASRRAKPENCLALTGNLKRRGHPALTTCW